MARSTQPSIVNLAEIPAGTELLRQVRHLTDDDLAEHTVDDLTRAARWLRAASYSAAEGARRLDRHIATRTRTEDPCSPSATTSPSPRSPEQ